MPASPWFVPLNAPVAPEVRLLCFTPAGSGAGCFRPWRPLLPSWVEVHAVQLPGREARLAEPPLVRSRAVVDALDDAFAAHRAALPLVFFGHSVGGRIAIEWARRMEADGGPAPRHVLLAAATEPRSLSAEDARSHVLDDDGLERYVGGFPPELRRFPRLLEPALRVLRADLEIFATERPLPVPPLSAPLSVFGGRHDDLVTPRMLEAWADWTNGQFELEWLDGDHFFPSTRAAEVVPRTVARLARAVGRAPVTPR